MAAVPTVQLAVMQDGSYALNQSDCIMAQVLAANTLEHVQAPANSKRVVFSADGDFYCRIDTASGTTIAVPAADVTDGSAGELNPAVRILPAASGAYIHLIASATRVVTMMFYLV